MDELGEDLKNIYQNRLTNGLPQMGQLGKKTVIENKLDELKVGTITEQNAIAEIIFCSINFFNQKIYI